MSIPFLFDSIVVQKKITSWYLYPSVVSLNLNTYRYEVESNKRKLIPYYTSQFLIVIVSCGFCLAEVILSFIYPNHVKPILTAFWIAVILFATYSWSLAVPSIFYGDKMVCYMNTLLDFEEKIRWKYNGEAYFVRRRENWSWKGYFRHMTLEILKIIRKRGKDCELIGVLINLVSLYMILLSFLAPIFCTIQRYDPIYYVLKDIGLHTNALFFRLAYVILVTVEGFRSFLMFILIPLHTLPDI